MSEDDDELVQWSFEVEFDDGTYYWRIWQSGSNRRVLGGEDRIDPTEVLKGICDRFNLSELVRVNRGIVSADEMMNEALDSIRHHVNQTNDNHEYVSPLPEVRSIADIKTAFDSAGSDDARRRILRWTQQYCADNGLFDD